LIVYAYLYGVYNSISKEIEKIKNELHNMFTGYSDFLLREISCGKESNTKMLVAYIDGFVDKWENAYIIG